MSVFTKIIDGEIPGAFVWSDDTCVAFATIEPHADGHVLVVPRREVDKFTDLDENTGAHLFHVAQIIGRAQEAAFDIARAGLVIAGFGVPHVHLHVIPMNDESVLSFASARKNEPAEKIEAAMAALRAALIDAGYGDNVPA